MDCRSIAFVFLSLVALVNSTCSAETCALQQDADTAAFLQNAAPAVRQVDGVVSPASLPGDGADSRHGAATDIIIIGDSWAEGARQILATNCAGKTVVNRGVGGSTAKEWSTETEETEGCVKPGQHCTAASAFEAQYGKDYTHAWLSVGGNDWLGSSCGKDNPTQEADLLANVKNTITKVLAKAPTGLRILMTGYGTLSAQISDACDATAVVKLQAAIKTAAEAFPDSVVFIDVMELFGGSVSSGMYSDAQWYGDNIHINAKGYAKMFKLPAVQSFFGCGGASQPTNSPTSSPPSEALEDFSCFCTSASKPVFDSDFEPEGMGASCGALGKHLAQESCGESGCATCSTFRNKLSDDHKESALHCCSAAKSAE